MRLGCEAEHSPPTSDEVKKTGIYTSIPPHAFMAQCLVTHRDNFTFYLMLQSKVQVASVSLIQIQTRGAGFNNFTRNNSSVTQRVRRATDEIYVVSIGAHEAGNICIEILNKFQFLTSMELIERINTNPKAKLNTISINSVITSLKEFKCELYRVG
jgi:hypothetical protein